MYNFNYIITNTLLSNIKLINNLVSEINNRRFPKIILYEFERSAREISTFASTSIEGNPLPLTDVKKILKSHPSNLRRSEQEVVNYNKALEWLDQKLEKGVLNLSLDLILATHKQVMEKLVSESNLGKLRLEPVFVNNPKTGRIIYWPPDDKDVLLLLNQLIDFINKNQKIVDPLILSGIFHKQFVVIHPFLDGNGRTARLITKTLLAGIGLNTFNLFSFENYYNKNVTNYFNNVGVLGNYYEVRNSLDFTKWLEYFTEGIIDELLRVKKLLPEISFSPKTELLSYHKKILNFIQTKGYITESDYAKLTERKKSTRNVDFRKLIDMGLIQRKGKGRASYYVLKSR